MGPGEVFIAFIVVGLPVILLIYMARRFFTFREKQLEAETSLAAEKAAQYAASNAELEQRIRVLRRSSPTAASKPQRRSRPCARPRRRGS
jgi:hypothetical protein